MLLPQKESGSSRFYKSPRIGKISKPAGPSGPWALKYYQSLGICKIYYSHFIFEVMYHWDSEICRKSWKSFYLIRNLTGKSLYVTNNRDIAPHNTSNFAWYKFAYRGICNAKLNPIYLLISDMK